MTTSDRVRAIYQIDSDIKKEIKSVPKDWEDFIEEFHLKTLRKYRELTGKDY